MGSSEIDTSPNLEGKVEKWWSDLQRERKCTGTCAISKIVNKTQPEEQEKVRQLIATLINEDISRAIRSKDIAVITALCSAINGCFDNFVHAADAANISFNGIIGFIQFCIDECYSRLFTQKGPKCDTVKVLELLHCLSRILVLILKLRRPLKGEWKSEYEGDVDYFTKILLVELSYKVSKFLKIDEILVDTKCNFVMGSLLIREIIVASQEKLKQFHEKFVMTLPEKLEQEEFQLNILRFLLSNAVLNTWSNVVIDGNSTKVYLRFFVQLCETHSRETPVVLNVSRALLLLVRNECFKECIMNLPDKDQINSLLSCIWMLVDHPVACIRHSAKDFLQILAGYEKFKATMLDSLSSLPSDKRSYFITLAALANESGSRSLLELNPELLHNLLLALHDPSLVTHVIYALESLILKDSLVNDNFPEWCETWILPLLESLSVVVLIVAADIEKLLDVVFKRYPSAIFYILNKWSEPKNDEELRCVITALKIHNRHGSKELTSSNGIIIASSSELEGKKWKGLISEKLLRFCLHHNNDDVRVSAFSLIIQGLKSTEKYTEQDFNLIRYFFTYNLNNQHPATRQKILSLIRKMLARFVDSLAVVRRMQNTEDIENYRKFKDWVVGFCFDNIFDSANFNRLNTVLSTVLSVIEYTGGVEVEESVADVYWRKILVALRSSYEENKVMAVTLARKLNIPNLIASPDDVVKTLFGKAYDLCGKIEPPNVLTGSYLVQILIEFPSFRDLARNYATDPTGIDPKLICVVILSNLLSSQVKHAEENLIKAAANGPMYGTLFAIRLIMQAVDFSRVDAGTWKSNRAGLLWPKFISTLIDLTFRMIDVVGCVVNSSSPEGHLPSDFQYDFQFSLDESLTALRERSAVDVTGVEIVRQQLEDMKLVDCQEELLKDCDRVIRRFNRVFLAVNNSSSFSQEIAEEFGVLLQWSSLLISKLSVVDESTLTADYFKCLCSIQKKLEKCLKIYRKTAPRLGKPTAQVLLLCAWRSIKEACLFLGDFMSKLPLEKAFDLGLITEETAIGIGEQLRTLLCEIKHRGAFEQAYIGFGQVMNAFWRCPRKNVSELPLKWLREILEEIRLPLKEQKMRFCSSRRSAGLPFLVQAIISSELQCINSGKIQTLEMTMDTLLDLAEKGDSVNLECKIHSLNILRALFKHAMLGEHVAPYVSRALMASIRGSRHDAWSIRNSSSLLFSSLVIRIFGVARNKDALSKKNKMTSRIFFQRYPELYEFFLSEMRLGCRSDRRANEYHPQPNIFHVLLILARLYPPPNEDSVTMDFSEFVPLIDTSCYSPTLKIRELGARALVPFISPEKLKEELGMRFALLQPERITDSNKIHGVLLQLKAVLSEVSCEHVKHVKESLEESGSCWIESTRWLLDNTGNSHVPYLIQIAYTQILHMIYQICHSLRQNVKSVFDNEELYGDGGRVSGRGIPGYFAFQESLNVVRFDIAAHEAGSQLTRVFLTLLKSEVDEVKAIPLRFLNYVALENREDSSEEDDVNSVSLRIRDLSCVQNEQCYDAVKRVVLGDPTILQYIVEYTGKFLKDVEDSLYSPHRVTTRLWMSVMSALLVKDVVSAEMCNKEEVLDSLLYLVECEDSDIAVNAFICFSVILFGQIEHGRVTEASMSKFIKLLFSFSDPDADVKQRAAAAEVFNKYYYVFCNHLFVKDNQALSIWTLPIRLMVDDDPSVRKSMVRLIPKYQKYVRENGRSLVVPLEDVSVSQLTLVPPKAQENLLVCYVNLLGEENLFHLVVQMVAWSLSAYVNAINCDHMVKQNEAGVFEKGNPNPFCEELAFADLVMNTIDRLKTVADVEALFEKSLDATHMRSLRDFLPTLTLPRFPRTLRELSCEIVVILTEGGGVIGDETASLLSVYVQKMKRVLNVY